MPSSSGWIQERVSVNSVALSGVRNGGAIVHGHGLFPLPLIRVQLIFCLATFYCYSLFIIDIDT